LEPFDRSEQVLGHARTLLTPICQHQEFNAASTPFFLALRLGYSLCIYQED